MLLCFVDGTLNLGIDWMFLRLDMIGNPNALPAVNFEVAIKVGLF